MNWDGRFFFLPMFRDTSGIAFYARRVVDRLLRARKCENIEGGPRGVSVCFRGFSVNPERVIICRVINWCDCFHVTKVLWDSRDRRFPLSFVVVEY